MLISIVVTVIYIPTISVLGLLLPPEYSTAFVVFFFLVLELELKVYTLSHFISPIFVMGFFFFFFKIGSPNGYLSQELGNFLLSFY
jgi:hypothetical protein